MGHISTWYWHNLATKTLTPLCDRSTFDDLWQFNMKSVSIFHFISFFFPLFTSFLVRLHTSPFTLAPHCLDGSLSLSLQIVSLELHKTTLRTTNGRKMIFAWSNKSIVFRVTHTCMHIHCFCSHSKMIILRRFEFILIFIFICIYFFSRTIMFLSTFVIFLLKQINFSQIASH